MLVFWLTLERWKPRKMPLTYRRGVLGCCLCETFLAALALVAVLRARERERGGGEQRAQRSLLEAAARYVLLSHFDLDRREEQQR